VTEKKDCLQSGASLAGRSVSAKLMQAAAAR
jgi:hypothetical protein